MPPSDYPVRPLIMKRVWHYVWLALLAATLTHLTPAPAIANNADVQLTWRLLDYIGVDYGGAVSGSQVVSESEYAEMKEFAGQVETRVKSLPDKPGKDELLRRSAALRAAIDMKAAPQEVAIQSRSLAAALLAAYPVPLAPTALPDLARGAKLYAENCAACHGVAGDGRGPSAAGLDPPPIDFTDKSRADQRSLFGLYQVITQGLEGTSMKSFDSLSEQDRWALAFVAGSFAYPASSAAAGEKLWQGAPIRERYPNLAALVGARPADLATAIGPDNAEALTAYLRRHPEAVSMRAGGSLTLTRERLSASLKAYAAGDRQAATNLALSAYLDGFEPVEPMLAARDSALMARIERAMGELRAAIAKGLPLAQVQAANEELARLFDEAEDALAPERASSTSSFLGAFGVLLREGLEAMLIVVAMIAFLRKTERTEEVGYVHGGWIAALAAGVVTWTVATYFISISGASRELTEGFGSLFAAIILVTVGIWMHGKSHAEAWQRYIREKMSRALSRQSSWFLFGLAFVVVYREVFETILFMAALWAQGDGLAMLGGVAAAAAVLASLAWLMLRYSARLPITQFFAWSAALIAVLAVVLAGKGIAALQEAGVLGVVPLSGIPRIQLLGVFPTTETVIAQLAVVVILIAGFYLNRRTAARTNVA